MAEAAGKSDTLDRLSNSSVMRLLRLLGPLAVLFGAMGYLQDLGDKRIARDSEAWQVVTTKAPGNSGKIEALQYLNRETSLKIPNPRKWGIPIGPPEEVRPGCCKFIPDQWVLISDYGPWKSRIRLDGIDLSAARGANGEWEHGAYLVDVNLSHATLYGARFTRADMHGADLSDAILGNADLSETNLSWAKLNNTQFAGANLSSAAFWFTRLSETSFYKSNLTGADFRGVDLRKATNLSQGQVDSICADENTIFPSDIRRPAKCQRDKDQYVVVDISGQPVRVR